MKPTKVTHAGAFALALGLAAFPWSTHAATTIDATNQFSYGANIGWMNWSGDVANGVVITDYICSGYIFAANVGWIHMGGGSPANTIQYQNNSATDFGVNLDALGNLRGYAYAANVGWINFETLGAAKLDLVTGQFSGYCYSANCGWISLSTLKTSVIEPGVDTDGDGMADAWELVNFGNLDDGAGDDPDGDGVTNLNEYLAGTDPNDPASKLAITNYTTTPGGTSTSLTWQSVPTRNYFIEESLDLSAGSWFDSGLNLILSDGASTVRLFGNPYAPKRFLRVRAVKPLSP
ncbi:MAG: hypothetical protein RLZZ214_13 [Verrucomicrobiota bacterium]|jgi:hypothetical protein